MNCTHVRVHVRACELRHARVPPACVARVRARVLRALLLGGHSPGGLRKCELQEPPPRGGARGAEGGAPPSRGLLWTLPTRPEASLQRFSLPSAASAPSRRASSSAACLESLIFPALFLQGGVPGGTMAPSLGFTFPPLNLNSKFGSRGLAERGVTPRGPSEFQHPHSPTQREKLKLYARRKGEAFGSQAS